MQTLKECTADDDDAIYDGCENQAMH